jgi:hypothetical protein
MANICIIGDSHIAAIRLAAQERGDLTIGHSLTFFGAPFPFFAGLEASGRVLNPTTAELRDRFVSTSGGKPVIDVESYDCFIIVSLGFGIGPLVFLNNSFHSDCFLGSVGDKYRISDECFLASSQDILSRYDAFRVVGMIRAIKKAPIVIVPTPNPAVCSSKPELPESLEFYFRAVREKNDGPIRGLFNAVCSNFSKSLDLRILELPKEAAENGVFNRREFSMLPDDLTTVDSTSLVRFMVHANSRYGALVLPQALAMASRPELGREVPSTSEIEGTESGYSRPPVRHAEGRSRRGDGMVLEAHDGPRPRARVSRDERATSSHPATALDRKGLGAAVMARGASVLSTLLGRRRTGKA